MLIRSQDKRSIININNIDTIFTEEGGKITAFNAESRTIVAEYSTIEKAIKALDMIQKEYEKYIYSCGGALATSNEYVQAFGFIPPKVFHMPQDDEV